MNIRNILKVLTIATVAAVAGGTALPMTPQESNTNAVAIPKFHGDIAQAGFVCDQIKYLPWKDEFHRGGTGYIDGIKPEHLDQPVKCGIDPWNRPFIAFKYVCTKVVNGVSTMTKGAAAIFQRYSDLAYPIVPGGHFMPKGCSSLGSIDPLNSPRFAQDFKGFIDGKPVQLTDWKGQSNGEIQICDDVRCPPEALQLPAPHREL